MHCSGYGGYIYVSNCVQINVTIIKVLLKVMLISIARRKVNRSIIQESAKLLQI